ncbi:hypothetical protein EK21DRAFT_40322, partial [Setomelanomma holmii]
MEVFGTVGAAIMLGPELLKLCRWLRRTFKAIKYAPRDLNKLVKEMEIFTGLYEDFYDMCTSDFKYRSRSARPVRLLVAWAQDAMRGLEKLHARVQALGGGLANSKLDKLIAYVRWHFSENEVKLLRSLLRVARESIIGFSNIRAIEKLDDQLEELRATIAQGIQQTNEEQVGLDLEARFEILAQKKRNRRQQRHANDKRLQEAQLEMTEQQEIKSRKSDVIPRTKHLLQFTRSVEEYVEEVLPAQESGRRRR